MDKMLRFTKNQPHKAFFCETKAPCTNDLSGIFLKDGAALLTTPICQLYSLSTSIGKFCDACRIAKLKPLFKQGSKQILKLWPKLPSTA